MRDLRRVVLCLAVVSLSSPVFGLEPSVIVVPQPDAPLRIGGYSAAYQEGGRYTTEGIRHELSYENASGRPIVAVQIGLVSFDVWNEFLDRTGGVSITDLAPGGKSKGSWVARAYGDFAFHTGVAYVAKVRFSDNTIWTADLQAVTAELRKIEKDFDVAKLKAKPEKP